MQDGVDAALVSANNVDVGVCETFTDELKEIEYENVRLNGLRYMDDILRMANEVKNAQEANDAMEEMIGGKNLQFNLDKSSFVIVGSKKATKKIRKDLEKTHHLHSVEVR